jgi:SET domain-containing protein
MKAKPYKIKRSVTGLGLFATETIPKGRRIIEYTGPLIPNEEVEKSDGKYFFGVNSKWSIDGSGRSNIARYINHSCRPNAEAFISGRRVWIWSKRKIKAGEEIAYDYGEEYFEGIIKSIGCKCQKCIESKARLTARMRKQSGLPKSAKKSKSISPSENNLRGPGHATAAE